MASRKIEKMHELFGTTEGKKCKTCRHLHGGKNEYRKCSVYGESHSEASDWCLSYDACGLWNEPYKGDIPIIKLVSGGNNDDVQIQGQMSIFEFLGE